MFHYLEALDDVDDVDAELEQGKSITIINLMLESYFKS